MFGVFGCHPDKSTPPTFKIFCKGNEGLCLAESDGALILAAPDPDDERQHFTKDVRYSRVIKDEEGNPVFSLVNKASGLAVQHSLGPGHPVRLARIYPDGYAESVLWTESADLRKAFGRIRKMHNVDLCLDASVNGTIVLSYFKGDNQSDGQSWKTVPWSIEACVDALDSMPTSRIYCKVDERFSVTVREGVLCLAPANSGDEYQHWIVDKRPGDMIRDIDAYPAFSLVNKVTGEAITGEAGLGCNLKLKPYNPNFLDASVLWTRGPNCGHGFRCIHRLDNNYLNFKGFQSGTEHSEVHKTISHDSEKIFVTLGTLKSLFPDLMGEELQWKIDPWCS